VRIGADGNFHNKYLPFVTRRSEKLGTSSRQFAVTHRTGVLIIVAGLKFNVENKKGIYHCRRGFTTVEGDIPL
jgi:hypothetical protein